MKIWCCFCVFILDFVFLGFYITMLPVIDAGITGSMKFIVELILRKPSAGNHDPAGAKTDFVEKISGKPA